MARDSKSANPSSSMAGIDRRVAGASGLLLVFELGQVDDVHLEGSLVSARVTRTLRVQVLRGFPNNWIMVSSGAGTLALSAHGGAGRNQSNAPSPFRRAPFARISRSS